MPASYAEEKSKAAVEDNTSRREKCVQQKGEIVALRSQVAEARRSAAGPIVYYSLHN